MKIFDKKDPLYYVKHYYSKSDIVKGYTSNKLFSSEEIIIQKYFKATTSILDIGCGAGRTSIALSKKKYQVTAFDLIPEMVEAAKQQAKIHEVKIDFAVINAAEMCFQHESF
jgi:2-polyprenyl-3-methyl-5-hydroxy-6-metoxy-1,4-benzoquinol methylase